MPRVKALTAAMRQDDEIYASVNTYRIGNAEVVVYRPNISDEERMRRETTLVHALERFGRALEIKKQGVERPC